MRRSSSIGSFSPVPTKASAVPMSTTFITINKFVLGLALDMPFLNWDIII